jgi:hypothetical protein
MDKTPEPLPHPYIATPQLREMSWPQTCALDVGLTREDSPPPIAVAEATRVSPEPVLTTRSAGRSQNVCALQWDKKIYKVIF